MPKFTIPKHNEEYFQTSRDDMMEYFAELAWEIDPADAEIGLIAKKVFEESFHKARYTITVYIFEQDLDIECEYEYKSYINIDGVRREDIEDLEYVRDKEITEMLIDQGMKGIGIGPKTFKRLVMAFENKALKQAYSILNKFGRKDE